MNKSNTSSKKEKKSGLCSYRRPVLGPIQSFPPAYLPTCTHTAHVLFVYESSPGLGAYTAISTKAEKVQPKRPKDVSTNDIRFAGCVYD